MFPVTGDCCLDKPAAVIAYGGHICPPEAFCMDQYPCSPSCTAPRSTICFFVIGRFDLISSEALSLLIRIDQWLLQPRQYRVAEYSAEVKLGATPTTRSACKESTLPAQQTKYRTFRVGRTLTSPRSSVSTRFMIS